MQSLDHKIKLPPTVIMRLLTCGDAKFQVRDYQRRYLETAKRYEDSEVVDEYDAVRNSAIYYRRMARTMELLTQWLDTMGVEAALEHLKSTTWRDVYRELGVTEIDTPNMAEISVKTDEFTYTYSYDDENLEPWLVPDWAVALIAELVSAKWECELTTTLLKLHQEFVENEY